MMWFLWIFKGSSRPARAKAPGSIESVNSINLVSVPSGRVDNCDRIRNDLEDSVGSAVFISSTVIVLGRWDWELSRTQRI